MFYITMLILHMLADFYIQTDTIVQNKKKNCLWLVIHSVVYGVVFIIPTIIVSIVYKKNNFICATLIIIVSHFVIDYIKCIAERKVKSEGVSIIVYLFDQLLHIAILYLSYSIFELDSFERRIQFSVLNKTLDLHNVFIYVLMVIVLLKPTSVFVKKCLAAFELKEESSNTTILKGLSNSGKAIGYFERMLTMILILTNQYGLLGLVLTAKSIARFKEFNNVGFAERYLIGTLASFITSLITILTLKTFLL